MKTFEEIKITLAQNKEELEQKFGVAAMGVFGSYTRNEQHSGSDVDILVDFKKPISLLRFIELERHISDLLGIKVDLVTRKALKPFIGRHILKELVEI